MRELIAKRYAKALIEALSDSERSVALEWLKGSEKAFKNEKFVDTILSPYVTKEAKSDIVIKILCAENSNCNEKLTNFIKLLAHKNRLELMPDICKELSRSLAMSCNEHVAVLTTKEKFDEATLKSIEALLAKRLQVKLMLSQREEDLEGVRLIVEDLGIEVSFLRDRFIHDLRNHILKAF